MASSQHYNGRKRLPKHEGEMELVAVDPVTRKRACFYVDRATGARRNAMTGESIFIPNLMYIPCDFPLPSLHFWYVDLF